MGAEVECFAKHAGKRAKGKAHLDSSELVFRSAELKFKIRFDALDDASADEKALRLRTSEGETILELGAKSAKWLDKILHPPSRIEKAGVKAGMRVRLVGIEDDTLAHEVEQAGGVITTKDADVVFLQADDAKQLVAIKKIDAASLWIVSPRGKPEIADVVVMAAAKKEGWIDIKVMRFNDTHTALKFVRRKEA